MKLEASELSLRYINFVGSSGLVIANFQTNMGAPAEKSQRTAQIYDGRALYGLGSYTSSLL
jgi:hypothetical protein